jgi:hypothetical protein
MAELYSSIITQTISDFHKQSISYVWWESARDIRGGAKISRTLDVVSCRDNYSSCNGVVGFKVESHRRKASWTSERVSHCHLQVSGDSQRYDHASCNGHLPVIVQQMCLAKWSAVYQLDDGWLQQQPRNARSSIGEPPSAELTSVRRATLRDTQLCSTMFKSVITLSVVRFTRRTTRITTRLRSKCCFSLHL